MWHPFLFWKTLKYVGFLFWKTFLLCQKVNILIIIGSMI